MKDVLGLWNMTKISGCKNSDDFNCKVDNNRRVHANDVMPLVENHLQVRALSSIVFGYLYPERFVKDCVRYKVVSADNTSLVEEVGIGGVLSELDDFNCNVDDNRLVHANDFMLLVENLLQVPDLSSIVFGYLYPERFVEDCDRYKVVSADNTSLVDQGIVEVVEEVGRGVLLESKEPVRINFNNFNVSSGFISESYYFIHDKFDAYTRENNCSLDDIFKMYSLDDSDTCFYDHYILKIQYCVLSGLYLEIKFVQEIIWIIINQNHLLVDADGCNFYNRFIEGVERLLFKDISLNDFYALSKLEDRNYFKLSNFLLPKKEFAEFLPELDNFTFFKNDLNIDSLKIYNFSIDLSLFLNIIHLSILIENDNNTKVKSVNNIKRNLLLYLDSKDNWGTVDKTFYPINTNSLRKAFCYLGGGDLDIKIAKKLLSISISNVTTNFHEYSYSKEHPLVRCKRKGYDKLYKLLFKSFFENNIWCFSLEGLRIGSLAKEYKQRIKLYICRNEFIHFSRSILPRIKDFFYNPLSEIVMGYLYPGKTLKHFTKLSCIAEFCDISSTSIISEYLFFPKCDFHYINNLLNSDEDSDFDEDSDSDEDYDSDEDFDEEFGTSVMHAN